MADQVKYADRLKGDKVLIFGGTSGIGYSVAEATLELGCTVIISSSREQKVQAKVAELQSLYPSAKDRISGVMCDLGDEADLEKNIVAVLEKVGKLDHIIHTAGDPLASKPITEIDFDFVKKAGLVRFYSPLLIAKHAARYLSGGPKSSFTLTTGSVSDRPIPNWSVVNSYATGLQGMARGLALDLKPIRVNVVSPGGVDTELWDNMPKQFKDTHFAESARKLPVGKVATPADIAESYIYLLRAQNVTGATIDDNGGGLLV